MGWSMARQRWVERAFSPANPRAPLPWGVAPGWNNAVPLVRLSAGLYLEFAETELAVRFVLERQFAGFH